MKKNSQLPLAFNNDRDIRRIRESSRNDLRLLADFVEREYSERFLPHFVRGANQKEALAGFLDKVDFDYFCTFTTRLPISLYSTRRIADKLCDHVQAGSSSSVFWAAENFAVRDGFHFHALMRMDPPYTKLELFDWYFQKYGRVDIIDNRSPDRQLAASYYVSKYVTKKITDYDILFCKYHMNRPSYYVKKEPGITNFLDKRTCKIQND